MSQKTCGWFQSQSFQIHLESELFSYLAFLGLSQVQYWKSIALGNPSVLDKLEYLVPLPARTSLPLLCSSHTASSLLQEHTKPFLAPGPTPHSSLCLQHLFTSLNSCYFQTPFKCPSCSPDHPAEKEGPIPCPTVLWNSRESPQHSDPFLQGTSQHSEL